MPGLGTLQNIAFSSTKNSAKNTVAVLQSLVNNDRPSTRHVIVFLGEQHNNKVDMEVTRKVLLQPPLVSNSKTRVIYEKGLRSLYPVVSDRIDTDRAEPSDVKSMAERNVRFAKMIDAAFDDEDLEVIYLVCGSDHIPGVFSELDKVASVPFTMLAKKSSSDA